MNNDRPQNRKPLFAGLLDNWISIAGITLGCCALFADFCLIAYDYVQGFSQPYLGLLTYLIVPQFIWIGIFLTAVGAWIERRRRKKQGTAPPARIDLKTLWQRRYLFLTFVCIFAFLVFTAFGTYKGYHATESVQFCGSLCHTVMNPEYTTYQSSPHAKVRCVECHIGPGATWFVRSKISGLYQVYATIFGVYPKPIPTPVKNLRPAQETCEECHWPEKFYGAVNLYHVKYLTDEKNTPWTIQMSLKVGGANPANGPVGGIHWHMIVGSQLEYKAADEQRQIIPWVRITDRSTGESVVYESKRTPLPAMDAVHQGGAEFHEKKYIPQIEPVPPEQEWQPIRRMDCIDCHNRPTHIFNSPNDALDVSLWLQRIDASIPFIKLNTVEALVRSAGAASKKEGLAQIAEKLGKQYHDYSNQKAIQATISETQKIFQDNFFPEMKTDWRVRFNNIGHHIWTGCFRCHDGNHVSKDGKTISNACDSCHLIVAQGRGLKPTETRLEGLKFEHPGGTTPPGLLCTQCHKGAGAPNRH
jgi:hypothetical protein